MNLSPRSLGVLILAASTLHAVEPAPRKGGIGLAVIPKDAGRPTSSTITDEELISRRNASQGTQSAPKHIPPVENAFTLLKMSTILEYGGNYTLLPKDSVIWSSPAQQSKLVASPTGKFMNWLTFLSTNRAWLVTHEVTHGQVAGKETVPEETMARFRKSNAVVVATFRGGPISMPPHTNP